MAKGTKIFNSKIIVALLIVTLLSAGVSAWIARGKVIKAERHLQTLRNVKAQKEEVLRTLQKAEVTNLKLDYVVGPDEFRKAIGTLVRLGGEGDYSFAQEGKFFLGHIRVSFGSLSFNDAMWLVKEFRKHNLFVTKGSLRVPSVFEDEELIEQTEQKEQTGQKEQKEQRKQKSYYFGQSNADEFPYVTFLDTTTQEFVSYNVPAATKGWRMSLEFAGVLSNNNIFAQGDTIIARVLKIVLQTPDITKEPGFWQAVTVKKDNRVVEGYALLQVLWRGNYEDSSKIKIVCGDDIIIRLSPYGITTLCSGERE